MRKKGDLRDLDRMDFYAQPPSGFKEANEKISSGVDQKAWLMLEAS